MASTPKLASCGSVPSDYLAIPVGSEVYLFVVKAPKGNPWREVEFFTQSALLASQLGSVFFDLYAVRMEVLDETFELTTGINLSGTTIRFYWNPGTSDTIHTLEYDVVSQQVVTGRSSLLFTGRDPFVLDARTGSDPNRIYLMYVKSGGNYFRISDDLGATWGVERTIDSAAALVRLAQGFISDPLGSKDNVSVVQKRDP